MTIVHTHTNINTGGAPAPASVAQTPPHTLDSLESAIKDGAIDALTGQKYIKIDARVLAWLIADSRALAAEGR